ncbi:cellulose biosynthesis protein BcsE [Pseudomonas citronellolis]|uniref:cellulose biosynthesis protein BcsE n=1 Tax=Pseudomonas citronellolis TaxID=53408 RepID=UPI0023E37A79|nr:cellulose biosynthesis protein BcsE [Pseudomonas citronellolis]MDF3931319.1 cellulose biosynthesis protein BcsE [Pseudomonas citronellolis]
MFASTLAVPGLPDRQAGMRVGGLYWLTCETQETADRLCRQVLAAQPVATRAVLVNAAGAARELVASIPENQGPGRLGLFDLKPRPPVRLIQALNKDVPRVRGGDDALWVIRVSLKDWDEMVAESLANWCRRAQAWLAAVRSTLLVVGDQPPPALFDMLLRYNDCVSGVGQIYIAQGARHLLQHFWSNEAGVNGPRDFLLPREGEGLRAEEAPEVDSAPPTADDQRQVLAQADALGGEAPPTAQWQVFGDDQALLDEALQAQVATVVFALGSSDEVPALAGDLHRLRKHCGRSLKLVVREMLPSLRQNDEQLLLANGANLIVPAGTPFLRFLTLLRSVQGHRWRRDLAAEPSAVLQRLRPLEVRGSLSPRAFAAAVKKMTDNTAGTEVRNQLLRLQPLPALDAEQVLAELVLRRNGDITCVAGGRLYLFLFACSASAIEPALRNVLRLPWQEVLAGYETVTPYSVLPGAEFQSDSIPTAPALATDPQRAAADNEVFQALRPQPASLASLGARP